VVAIGVAVLLALFVVPSPWGIVLVGSALAWEILEKAFWFSYTKRIPLAVGPETMVGRQVEVIAACRPDGKVRLQSERWKARCSEGAEIGDTVTVEAVERLTLIVTSRAQGMPQAFEPGASSICPPDAPGRGSETLTGGSAARAPVGQAFTRSRVSEPSLNSSIERCR
jgi:membrane protein implicated in regulation of membrane protease activity